MGLAQPRKLARSADLRSDQGFTLIELLVGMLVGLIVVGGGVYGLARAFNVSNASTARVTASSNAEVGIERLVVDLRDAVNGGCSFNKTSLTGVVVSLSGSVTTVQMCDPNVNGTAIGNAPPTEAVQWVCNTAAIASTVPAQTCVRSMDTGTSSTPAVSTNSRISGVQTLRLKGILNAAGGAVFLPCGTTVACTATQSVTYTLASGAALSLSWVGLAAGIGQNVAPGAGGTQTVAASQTLAINTGAALRNFGTS
jgi:prepilin-type N-terminal cleavage/methylation domain-containing protein